MRIGLLINPSPELSPSFVLDQIWGLVRRRRDVEELAGQPGIGSEGDTCAQAAAERQAFSRHRRLDEVEQLLAHWEDR